MVEEELAEQLLASRDSDLYEAPDVGSPFNKKRQLVQNRQCAAKNPLANLGGGNDEALKGKAADRSGNINTKPTNAKDMYDYNESTLTMIKKNMDEFPTYEKDE